MVDRSQLCFVYSTKLLRDFQAASGIDLNLNQQDYVRVSVMRAFLKDLDEKTLTYLIDYKLSKSRVGYSYGSGNSRSLELILHSAGSKWTVGARQGRYGLVSRIPAGVVQIVEEIVSAQDKASEMLKRAWEKAYGLSSSPSDAYHDAVKAVEILANPLLSPKDKDATLGKDINVLRTQKEKWSFVMSGSKHTTAVEHILSMMQLLWHSQSDRHGQADYEDVSVQEAQAAVLLASTLVGWLAQSALKKDDLG